MTIILITSGARRLRPALISQMNNEQIAGMHIGDLELGSLFKQEFMNSSITHIKSELIRESYCASAIP